MKEVTISAPTVSNIYPTLDKVKMQIEAVAREQGVSQVLMLVTLKDWCERQLKSEVEFEMLAIK